MASQLEIHKGQYGRMSFVQWIQYICALLFLPFILFVNIIASPWSKRNKHKTWRRVLADTALRYLLVHVSVPGTQFHIGSTLNVYKKLVKKLCLPILIESLGAADIDGKLLWFDEKTTEGKVILYFHGGAFVLGLQPYTAEFWRQIQVEFLKEDNIKVGLAMLNYSIVPEATFPTPLVQATAALNHILASGVRLENITLVGESAGGNLVLQVLSHMLHPMEGIPVVNVPKGSRLNGALMMSPWVEITDTMKDQGSAWTNRNLDFITPNIAAIWGANVLDSFPSDAPIHYLDTTRAPEKWFSNLDVIVDRVCIGVGQHEILLDDAVDLAKRMEAETEGRCEITLFSEEHGIHNEIFLDVFVWQKERGQLAKDVIGWVREAVVG